jgi:type I restriction enzyme M protein
MPQLENITAIEKRLWSAADNLRANSNYASNEYFMPVMGLIFLRHAYSRFLSVQDEIQAALPKRGGKTRALRKEDFSRKGSIFLKPAAQFDHLVSLSDKDDRAQAVIAAMESIEADYTSLKGALPKAQYQELDNAVLGQLLRTLNPEELQRADGDIFGRIYEYFLTQFADQGAHDGGEFFTPVSLVSLIAQVLEPRSGIVLDPACGSGGMFVQSAHIVEALQQNPAEKLTFYGLEKNGTTIELARMNLAVHGLEGQIQKAISYYDDPHELLGKCDFVMANPPFNVDEVDADKVKRDPRLPFGLPGVNKKGKVSNANYLWISYFYSYLNERGRAGFVMSSQSSSAGRDEAVVRQKLVESGGVDVMVAIRGNFFYTRTVPCELWFLDKGKPKAHRDKVLMLDARNIYRKVTRKIFDFSPEQQQNLLAIVWLYRGERKRFARLVWEYRGQAAQGLAQAHHALAAWNPDFGAFEKLHLWTGSLNKFTFGDYHSDEVKEAETTPDAVARLREVVAKVKPMPEELMARAHELHSAVETARESVEDGLNPDRDPPEKVTGRIDSTCTRLDGLDKDVKTFLKQAEAFAKAVRQGADIVEKELGGRKSKTWKKDWNMPAAWEEMSQQVEILRAAHQHFHYFLRQVHWLLTRFPEAELRDVEGLVKLVDQAEIEKNDWSLTPGRYVGVAPEEVDEDFDFGETLREIHQELSSLNDEATELAAKIAKNFEELGV